MNFVPIFFLLFTLIIPLCKSIKFLTRSYEDLPNKGIYENFDYAQFLKNNEKFDESIYYYSEILKNIDNKHIIYPEAIKLVLTK